MRKLTKKGGLDVSINSIVVIVFAITMLGIGLAFINGLFGRIEVPIPKPTVHASAESPIVLYRDTLLVDRGKPYGLTINFYNNELATIAGAKPTITKDARSLDEEGDSADPALGVSQGCINEEGSDVDFFRVTSPSVSLTVGDETEIKSTLSVDKSAPKGLYTCDMVIGLSTHKQFSIEVKG